MTVSQCKQESSVGNALPASCRLLAQVLNLRIEADERELTVSLYKRAANARAHTTPAIIGRGNFPL